MRVLLTLALLALVSCGPSAPSETGEFTLIIAKDAVALAASGTTTVNITVSPTNGFKKDVSFTAAEPTGTIKTTFEPTNSATGTVLKLEVPAGAAAKDYPVLIKGSSTVNGAAVERTESITVTVAPPPGITVGGTVRNGLGNVIAGVDVSIGATNATTDANGAFSISNVTAPYTAIVRPTPTTKHEFVGLTRADPNLVLFGFEGGAPLSGSSTVSGTLSGGAGFPNPANHVTGVIFGNSGDGSGFASLLATQGPTYSFSAKWTGSSTQSGTLYALQCKLNPAVVTLCDSFPGWAKKSVTLTNGLPSAGNNLALAAVTESAITANLTLPSGVTLTLKRLFLSVGAKSIFLLDSDPSANLSSTYKTPAVGQTLGFVVDAKKGSQSVLWQKAGLQPNEIVNVSVPNPVGVSSPAIGGSGVSKTPSIAWSTVSNSIYLLAFGDGATTTVVYTKTPNHTASLNGNTKYTWVVSSVGPFATLDEFAGNRYITGYPLAGYDQTFFNTTSETANFTTVP